MHYYTFHLGDYYTATSHLTLFEDLAYRRLIDAYCLREGPLPSSVEDVSRLIRMPDNPKEVERVLAEFFTRSENGWSHDRCEKTVSKTIEIKKKRRRAGLASAAQRSKKRPKNSSSAQPIQRDAFSDALATHAERSNPEKLSAERWSLVRDAAEKILEIDPSATPAAVAKRAENYAKHMPNATISAKALANHWDRCANAPQTAKKQATPHRQVSEVPHSETPDDSFPFSSPPVSPADFLPPPSAPTTPFDANELPDII